MPSCFRWSFRLLPLVAVLLIPTGAFAQADSSWTSILSPEDTTSWQHIGDGTFEVSNEALVTRGGMGLLWYTPGPVADVVLRVVYKNPGGDNSGVFIRIPEPPESAWQAVHGGYEVQIDDTGDEYHRTGVLYDMTAALNEPGAPAEDGWNVMDVTLDGPRTVVVVNGQKITDYVEGQPQRARPWYLFWKFWAPKRGERPISGYIGLQNHGRQDTVYFREISLKPLRP